MVTLGNSSLEVDVRSTLVVNELVVAELLRVLDEGLASEEVDSVETSVSIDEDVSINEDESSV